MIFFQILIFIISIVFLLVSISGFGRLSNLSYNKNFFLDVFLGFINISFIVTLIHFFFKINQFISISIFILGIIFFFYKKNISSIRLFKIENIYFCGIIILLIPIFLSQKYHEDFGYYHLPYAISFIEEKIIFGFANIDNSFVYNSIWLNLYSIFFINDKNFDFLTLPSFLLFLTFILFSFNQLILNNKKLISDYFLLITLFYFILKFTRISEFGVDLPASIFSILAIYYFLRFSENVTRTRKKEYFFLILIFSIFSILVKLSTIPVILLPTFLYLKYLKDLKFDIFKLSFFFIYILLVTFFFQQFVYTGCLLFPSNLTCLEVSWFSDDNINLSKQLELINKGYFSLAKDIYTPEDYLKNFNWLSFWIKRNFIEIFEHLFTIIVPILLFSIFQKKKTHYKFILNDKLGIDLFLILGLLFWLNFSPIYRFAIYLFVTLIFILLIKSLISKNFSQKFFLIFVTTFIFFSFSKNVERLSKVDNIFLGISKIDNKYILNEKNVNTLVKIYQPDIENNRKNGWQGRLCWNTPFICSYNKLDVRKKKGYLVVKKIN